MSAPLEQAAPSESQGHAPVGAILPPDWDEPGVTRYKGCGVLMVPVSRGKTKTESCVLFSRLLTLRTHPHHNRRSA